jgi:hypothetical protein
MEKQFVGTVSHTIREREHLHGHAQNSLIRIALFIVEI